jgi:hypothetical protein
MTYLDFIVSIMDDTRQTNHYISKLLDRGDTAAVKLLTARLHTLSVLAGGIADGAYDAVKKDILEEEKAE